jgi:aspartyl-tRNA(Asn)/glutamyl-tRNA(Gln) amidotransferase subunit C
MKVTPDIVRKVAKIAHLDLTEGEVKKFSKDLNDILSAFKDLDKAKANVEPSFQPLEIKDVVRDDKPEDVFSQETALANTKHKEKGFFKGPRAV